MSRATSVRIARGLAAGLGVFALAVGAHDALRVSVLADRLTGTAFVLAGALLVAAALASRMPPDREEDEQEEASDWRILLGVAAGLVGVGIGCFLLLAALEDPAAREPRWLLPWVAVTLAGVVLTAIYLVAGRGRIARSAKGPLHLVASGVAATVLLGLVQLWHESASKASQGTPNVVLETRVTPAGNAGPLRAFEVEFRAKNLSEVPVVVVGSRYGAHGVWFDKLPPGDRTDEAFGNRLRAAANGSVHRAAHVRDVEFLHGGPMIPDNYILLPDERYVSRRVVLTEPGRYDELDVYGYAYVARKDRLWVDIPSVPETKPQRLGTGVLAQTALDAQLERLPIEEKSLIGRLTAPARNLLRVRIVDAEGDYEDLIAYVDVKSHNGTRPLSKVDADESLERYGFTVASSSNEVFIGPSTVPPAPPPKWAAFKEADTDRLYAHWRSAEYDGTVLLGRQRWVLGHLDGKGVAIREPGTDAAVLQTWRNGAPCPGVVPDAVMEWMGFRDSQAGTCSAPVAARTEPDFEAVSEIADAWPRRAGRRTEYIVNPWSAALRMHPGDAKARRHAQKALDKRGLVGGVCAERLEPVRIRSCRLRFEGAAQGDSGARWAASRWLAVPENLLVDVRTATSTKLGLQMTLATTDAGTEAAVSKTVGDDAVLVVAGPAEPDDAQAHAERVAESLIGTRT